MNGKSNAWNYVGIGKVWNMIDFQFICDNDTKNKVRRAKKQTKPLTALYVGYVNAKNYI